MMRASRLLQILLLLQNRGRMTSGQLAGELEVNRRTILRDVDALTEAGLPIIVHQGNRGGIELGFNYRTRLTGLAADEAEAIAIMLTRPVPELAMLGLADAGERCRRKMLESFPDVARSHVDAALRRYRFELPSYPRRTSAFPHSPRRCASTGWFASMPVRIRRAQYTRWGWSCAAKVRGRWPVRRRSDQPCGVWRHQYLGAEHADRRLTGAFGSEAKEANAPARIMKR
jgi:biotin operon repressor